MKSFIERLGQSKSILLYIFGFLITNIVLFLPFMLLPMKILRNNYYIVYAVTGMPQKYFYVFLYFICSFFLSLIILNANKETIKSFSRKTQNTLKANNIFSVAFGMVCLLNVFMNFFNPLLVMVIVPITVILTYVLLIMFLITSFKLINSIEIIKR